MLTVLGQKFTDLFQRYMPNSFIFALIMTLLTMIVSFLMVDVSPMKIIISWYDGFWSLLTFGMQIVLIIITGFAIALSPAVKKTIHHLSRMIRSPGQVYLTVVFFGVLVSWISFGWIVITCVLARELALKVKGIHYPFLIACVYFSGGSWVTGLSSSIPLLLNTDENYLIKQGILATTIPTSYSLGSSLNVIMIILFAVLLPLVMTWAAPKTTDKDELSKMILANGKTESAPTIEEEVESMKLPFKSMSDSLNNSRYLSLIVAGLGLIYILYHFYHKGFDLDFNIMIFVFICLGMLAHKTPMRYVVAMKRASSNISGILFQYPFYAGIMGIMLYTGLGNELATLMASVADANNYPFYAFVTGGLMNIVIPSAGGEFAVIGPTIIEAVKSIAGNPGAEEMQRMIVRASMSVAYGESLSNCIQPFYLLLVLPVMGAGIKIQARDVMGYLMMPMAIFFVLELLLLLYWPL